MKVNRWLRVLNLAISILMAFDPTYLFVGPWILVQFLNGRQWFADVVGMGDFMMYDNGLVRTLTSWQSLVIPVSLGLFAGTAFVAYGLVGLSELVALKLAAMMVAHVIGYGWFKLVVPSN